jgi:hypothetical protein
VGLPLRR